MAKASNDIIHEPWKYYALLCTYGALLLVCILSRWFTGGFEWLTQHGFYNADFFTAVLIVVFATSWQPVRAGHIGGITVLNQPSLEVGSGWYLLLPGSELGTLPLPEQNDQFPPDP
jgi:hypothetical protein